MGKKKGNAKKGGQRPMPTHQDSLRRDIDAARIHITDSDAYDGEDGDDIADQLLAALDARDKAAAGITEATEAEPTSNSLQVPDGGESSRVSSLQSGSSEKSAASSSSPLKSAGEKLLHVGERMFHHNRSPSGSSSIKSPPLSQSPPTTSHGEKGSEQRSDVHRRGSIMRIFGHHATSSGNDDTGGAEDGGKRKVSRQKARLERKAAEMEAQRVQAEEELKANGGKPDEAQRERVAITDLCKALNVEMHEINPDGHCLYAAVADQLNILGKAPSHKVDYLDMRKSAAGYMRTHADDFMPFISDSDEHMAGIENKEAGTQSASVSQQQRYFQDYCDAVEKTAVWGGQPEILALSRAFHTPIFVVQAGCPVVKVGVEEGRTGEDPVTISYHRHMYGLGEHYNSLHKLSTGKK